MAQEEPDGGAVEPVGAALLRMRRHAGLTGQQLGRMVGMSQTKISRIETGQASPLPADVARLARALGAEEEIAEELATRAGRNHDRMTDWRQMSGPMRGMQDEVGVSERKASVVRIFQPGLVVGLAQTSEYARVVISSIREIYASPSSAGTAGAVDKAVTARVQRQEVLTAPGHEFHFVMSEAALGSRIANPAVMIAQIERLRELARQENVDLRFVPSDGELPMPFLHGFEIVDDDYVAIDLFNTGLTSRGANDVAAYREVFDRIEAGATSDIEPILKKYRGMYVRELTRDDAGES